MPCGHVSSCLGWSAHCLNGTKMIRRSLLRYQSRQGIADVSRICLDIKMRLVSKIFSRLGNFGDLWQLLTSLRSSFRWSWSTDLVHWTLRNPWAADLEWCRHWCCGHLDWLPKTTRLPAGRCGHPGRLESQCIWSLSLSLSIHYYTLNITQYSLVGTEETQVLYPF